MAKHEDADTIEQETLAVDIPDLGRKNEERKKAAAGWWGVKPGAASSVVGRGGARAAAGSWGGGGTAGVSLIGAAALGRGLLAMGAAGVLMGLGAFGYSMYLGGAAAGNTVYLDKPSSALQIRAGGKDRTQIVSKGEIRFDPLAKAAAQKAPEAAQPQKAAEQLPAEMIPGDAIPPAMTAVEDGKGADRRRGILGGGLSVAKPSSSVGGLSAGKSIGLVDGAVTKPNVRAVLNGPAGKKGGLGASRAANPARATSGAGIRKLAAAKAFGQLKAAKGMSMAGANSGGAETSRATAGNAFDANTAGGMAPGAPSNAPEPDTVNTPGASGGAPDTTAPEVAAPAGNDSVSRDQAVAMNAMVEQGRAVFRLRAQAAAMATAGAVAVAAGVALIVAGIACLYFGVTAVNGLYLIYAGIAAMAFGASLIAASGLMMAQSVEMEEQALKMSRQQYAATGNKDQYEANNYCIKKAVYLYADAAHCDPPKREDQEKENKNAVDRAVTEYQYSAQVP